MSRGYAVPPFFRLFCFQNGRGGQYSTILRIVESFVTWHTMKWRFRRSCLAIGNLKTVVQTKRKHINVTLVSDFLRVTSFSHFSLWFLCCFKLDFVYLIQDFNPSIIVVFLPLICKFDLIFFFMLDMSSCMCCVFVLCFFPTLILQFILCKLAS